MKNKSYWSLTMLVRRSNHLPQVMLALALILYSAEAKAGVPDWLRIVSRLPVPRYSEETDAVRLLDERLITVDDKGETVTVCRKAYRILRPEGRRHALVTLYNNTETSISSLKGWSTSAQGAEYEVKEKDAIETVALEESLYHDTRYKILKIPGAEPGSVIGLEYEIKRRSIILQDAWTFQDETPVRKARLALRLPKGWRFQALWINHPDLPPGRGEQNQWVWELEDVPPVEEEPLMPSREAVAGRVMFNFIPARLEEAAKSHTSWGDVGRWYSHLVDGRREVNSVIRQKVSELIDGKTSSIEKMRALAAFVQRDIRYVAIEIGIGGYQPHRAEEIFANRYGDCKDKVTLLSAMLREVGVESYYVLVNSSRGVVQRDYPSARSFDHAILAIRLPEDSREQPLYSLVKTERGAFLFFDPTDPFVPLGHLPPALQSNHGLLVVGKEGELVSLPLLSPQLNRLHRTGNFRLSESGTLRGDVQEVCWGAAAADRRARLLAAPAPERPKIMERLLAGWLGEFSLQDFQIDNLENYEANLVVRYRFKAESYAKKAGNLLLVRPRVLGNKQEGLKDKEGKEQKRRFPIEFPAAVLQSDFFEIELPKGYEVEELPPPVDSKLDAAEYCSKVEVINGVLRYQRNYTVKQVLIAPDRLPELLKFYRQIAADERNSAVLKQAQQPLQPQ